MTDAREIKITIQPADDVAVGDVIELDAKYWPDGLYRRCHGVAILFHGSVCQPGLRQPG
jgi:hypothetical protein